MILQILNFLDVALLLNRLCGKLNHILITDYEDSQCLDLPVI